MQAARSMSGILNPIEFVIDPDFSEWGASIGESTSAVVQYFLTSGKEPEQGFKACASMRKLEERYGAKRLENACGRLLAFSSSPSVRVLNTILKNSTAL